MELVDRSFVTSITKAAGKKFFVYELEPRGQNNFTQAIQSDATVGTVAYEQRRRFSLSN